MTEDEARDLVYASFLNGGLNDVRDAKTVKEAYHQAFGNADPAPDELHMLAAIYYAGRVQGVRGERSRRQMKQSPVVEKEGIT